MMEQYGFSPKPNLSTQYVWDGNGRVLKISSQARRTSGGHYLIPAAGGGEYYLFDILGRHHKSVDSLSGVTLHAFEYDGKGRLTGVKDSHENTTRIEYTEAGEPRALIAPDGARTVLGLNENGYLETLTDPAGES
jgi:YD repeat-containing protein